MGKTATVTSKGQITIPREIRESLRLEPGDKVIFERRGENMVMTPVDQGGAFEEFRGKGPRGIGRGRKAVLRWVRDVRGEL